MSSFKVNSFEKTTYERIKTLAIEQKKMREGRCPFKDGETVFFKKDGGGFIFTEASWKNGEKSGTIPAVQISNGKDDFNASLSLFLSAEMPEDNEVISGLFPQLKDTRNYTDLIAFFEKPENADIKLVCLKKLDTTKNYDRKIIVFAKKEEND